MYLVIRQCRYKTLKVVLLPIIFSLVACGGGRHIANPSAPPLDLGIGSSNKDLRVSLNYLIIPDGPGAWVKKARWDEYVVTIRNLSSKPVTIEKIRLVDPRGLYIEGGINPWQLEKQSEQLAESYKEFAAIGGMQVAPSVLLFAGFGAAAVVLAPIAAIGAPIYYFTKSHARVKDREAIEEEFNRRKLETFTLAEGSTVTGSAFFPIVPSPKALVVDYHITDHSRTIQVSLEKLAGLHLVPIENKENQKP